MSEIEIRDSVISSVRIRRPDDFHVHLRDGEMLWNVAQHTAVLFGRALVMPNLQEPVLTEKDAAAYKGRIFRVLEHWKFDFEPLMTIKLTQATTSKMIDDLRVAIAVKLYPEGVTTNSEGGVRDPSDVDPDVFRAMADKGIVLSVHAEQPGAFCLVREERYLEHIERIALAHPKLKIVVEHVSTEAAARFVLQASENIAATITAHHLLLTLDDVVGDRLRPHNFCKPIAKGPVDRATLRTAAIGSPKFFLGTDSAPHKKESKECDHGCAGCFTAPIALDLCTEVFAAMGRLEALGQFTSERGARFYGLPPNSGTVTIERREYLVPSAYGDVVPFRAGETLGWKAHA